MNELLLIVVAFVFSIVAVTMLIVVGLCFGKILESLKPWQLTREMPIGRADGIGIDILQLQSQSTAKLVLLSVITYGVYTVYFLRRLTDQINVSLDPEYRISHGFVVTNFVFAYLSLAMLALFLIVPEGHPVVGFSDFLNRIYVILVLVWSFTVRNRLNSLLASTPGTASWFHGFWTFLFQYWYINYKINVLCEAEPEQRGGADAEDSAAQP